MSGNELECRSSHHQLEAESFLQLFYKHKSTIGLLVTEQYTEQDILKVSNLVKEVGMERRKNSTYENPVGVKLPEGWKTLPISSKLYFVSPKVSKHQWLESNQPNPSGQSRAGSRSVFLLTKFISCQIYFAALNLPMRSR